MLSPKDTVIAFNRDVIQNGNRDAFDALMAEGFINHAAPPGAPRGPEGMWHTFQNVLRPALSHMQVVIHVQVVEGAMVSTRKSITGTHTGELLGIAPTQRAVSIDVIDIVRVVNGQYVEHWGVNTLPTVLASLSAPVTEGPR